MTSDCTGDSAAGISGLSTEIETDIGALKDFFEYRHRHKKRNSENFHRRIEQDQVLTELVAAIAVWD